MNEQALRRQRDRTHAIVEGALLGDIAIVFLLMRVYFPVPMVRTLIRALTCVPFIMLTQRRGVKMTILAGIASYVLFSALVGPILGLTAIDVAVSGILIGIGRRVGIGAALNTLWVSVVYSVLDIILPTIASLFIFRYPVKDLIGSAHHFVQLVFRFMLLVLHLANAPLSVVHTVHSWERPAVENWQWAWIGVSVLYGLLTIYLAVLVSELVLRELPAGTLQSQKAA
jgi:uncharacterized protein YybS (DUF2232 family)